MNLIDLDAAIYSIDNKDIITVGQKMIKDTVICWLESLPMVDAVPVVHGEWSGCAMNWKCSSCKQNSRYTSNYCPNCGARMDGGDHGKE